MRLVLWGLLGVAVSLPLIFVLLLVVAAKYPAMDRFTMKMPASVRSPVAELTMRRAGYDKDSVKQIDRVIALDSDNPDAWSRRCNVGDNDASGNLDACRRAVRLNPSAWNFNGLGSAQESAKDYCAAEDSYTNSIRKSANQALYLRNMARAALRCGHTGASVAGFEVAENLDAKAAADPDDEDDAKSGLVTDREYLIIAYDRSSQPSKAAAICTKAHPEWKICHCDLTDTSIECSDKSGSPASKGKKF